MTTLAIIGGGIAGRSLLYALAKEKNLFSEIILFESDFASACSLNSTAVVASRGVTLGHSPLGDKLYHAFQTFVKHTQEDKPDGVEKTHQYTGGCSQIEALKVRYPRGSMTSRFEGLELTNEFYISREDGFIIEPLVYLEWLKSEAQKKLTINRVKDYVIQVTKGERTSLKTQGGEVFEADTVVFTTGAYTRFWKPQLSRPIQGSYLEFLNIDLGCDSFSLTLEEENLVYHRLQKKMLMGSTTHKVGHELSDEGELMSIHSRWQGRLKRALPAFKEGQIKVGLREKAAKREPYLIFEGKTVFMGGFYKNGFSLGLMMSRNLISHWQDERV